MRNRQTSPIPSENPHFRKNAAEKAALTLCAGALAMLLGGCCAREHYKARIEHASVDGTPILTRVSAKDTGARLFGLGVDPSMKSATEKLYAAAARSGCPIAGNNYAFQNMFVEENSYFLFPLLGWKTLEVSADLYSYEYPVRVREEQE